jgi:hypothetical protein
MITFACCFIFKQLNMSTIELEAKKAEIARNILMEADERIILTMFEAWRNLQQRAGKRQSASAFLNLAHRNRTHSPQYKFNREECYDR